MVGEEGGESGSGIRLAYSTSMRRLRFCIMRPPAEVHTGPTPGCWLSDLLTSAASSAQRLDSELKSTDLLAFHPLIWLECAQDSLDG
jgi:hypothetical protein